MIHPTAVIHPKARLGTDMEIGPYCVIGENVQLGDRCQLLSHVVIDGMTTVGSANRFFPFACIGLQTQDLKYRGGICSVAIGDNNTFREYATVHASTFEGAKTVVGCHGNFLAYTHIAHDCQIGHYVIISNVGTLAGHVIVEDRAVIGGLAAVHQFVRIGKMAMIGGCSKVVQDIPPFMIADGHPAEVRTVNKEGLKRNGLPEETQACLRSAFKILFRSGLNLNAAVERLQNEIPPSAEVKYLIEFVQNSERGISK
jgi:UDP-N-acetylglucosamine acyltransferase